MVLGRLFKIHPAFELSLFEILSQDPCGVVVLISERVPGWNAGVHARASAHHTDWAGAGNPSVMSRIRYVSYWNYVHLLSHSSVILDTYPYGGCLTSQEGLSNGKIVVTRPSSYVRGRFTLGLYEQMGAVSAVAGSGEEFVDLAVRAATNEDGFGDQVRSSVQSGWERVHSDDLGSEWAEAIVGMWSSSSRT